MTAEPLDLAAPRIDPSVFVAPSAVILGDIEIARDAVVMFGVVMRAELDRITIGERTNVQDLTVLHVDAGIPCSVGNDVTIGHSAVVHGASVGNHCLVGIGARLLNGSELGEGAWIAASSVLPEGKRIPPWTLALGTPARPIRELTEVEVADQRAGIATYQQFAATYLRLFQ